VRNWLPLKKKDDRIVLVTFCPPRYLSPPLACPSPPQSQTQSRTQTQIQIPNLSRKVSVLIPTYPAVLYSICIYNRPYRPASSGKGANEPPEVTKRDQIVYRRSRNRLDLPLMRLVALQYSTVLRSLTWLGVFLGRLASAHGAHDAGLTAEW
jgi:hypothetical protein